MTSATLILNPENGLPVIIHANKKVSIEPTIRQVTVLNKCLLRAFLNRILNQTLSCI